MKTFLMIILISLALFGGEQATIVKIMTRIAKAVVPKDRVAVCSFEERVKGIVNDSPQMYQVDECDKADIVFARDVDTIPVSCRNSNTPIFMMGYRSLKLCRKAIGAFYWQKGRPNIIFLNAALTKNRITLPGEFERYIEDEL